jgi:anti-sigma B factor antagonist
LDISSVDDLRAAVLAVAHEVEVLRLDLSGVGFIDSAALGALLGLRGDLRAASVRFEITAAEGAVRQAVAITGLSDLLA